MDKLYPLVLEHRLPTYIRYGLSLVIMLLCSILQIALQMTVGYPGFFLLLPGVFVSGLLFNRGSGGLAAVVAIAVGAYFSCIRGVDFEYVAANALFAVTAAGTAVVAEFLRAEMKRVMLADKTKTLLLQEMAHRTKNNLAVLGAMIRLEAKNADNGATAALEATARRLQVTAEVYDHLSFKQDNHFVDMRYFLNNIVDKIFQSLAPSGPVAFDVQSENVDLPNREALAIGIIVNELVTNSLKYAFPGSRPGHIRVEFSSVDGIELSVCDNGVGLVMDGDPSGLGSRIVLLLAQQLGGKLVYERQNEGLCIRLRAPAASVA